jgi:hypothetical protein
MHIPIRQTPTHIGDCQWFVEFGASLQTKSPRDAAVRSANKYFTHCESPSVQRRNVWTQQRFLHTETEIVAQFSSSFAASFLSRGVLARMPNTNIAEYRSCRAEKNRGNDKYRGKKEEANASIRCPWMCIALLGYTDAVVRKRKRTCR